ncbi:hypothetical protein ACI78V_06220 [Geodermatophilus sp. SYSU D00742]
MTQTGHPPETRWYHTLAVLLMLGAGLAYGAYLVFWLIDKNTYEPSRPAVDCSTPEPDIEDESWSRWMNACTEPTGVFRDGEWYPFMDEDGDGDLDPFEPGGGSGIEPDGDLGCINRWAC